MGQLPQHFWAACKVCIACSIELLHFAQLLWSLFSFEKYIMWEESNFIFVCQHSKVKAALKWLRLSVVGIERNWNRHFNQVCQNSLTWLTEARFNIPLQAFVSLTEDVSTHTKPFCFITSGNLIKVVKAVHGTFRLNCWEHGCSGLQLINSQLKCELAVPKVNRGIVIQSTNELLLHACMAWEHCQACSHVLHAAHWGILCTQGSMKEPSRLFCGCFHISELFPYLCRTLLLKRACANFTVIHKLLWIMHIWFKYCHAHFKAQAWLY